MLKQQRGYMEDLEFKLQNIKSSKDAKSIWKTKVAFKIRVLS